jgi:hypothetical protein
MHLFENSRFALSILIGKSNCVAQKAVARLRLKSRT